MGTHLVEFINLNPKWFKSQIGANLSTWGRAWRPIKQALSGLMPPMTRLRGLACICFCALLGVALGYVPAVKKLVAKPHWPPPRYQKKAADVLRFVAAYNTTDPLAGMSERKLQNAKTYKTADVLRFVAAGNTTCPLPWIRISWYIPEIFSSGATAWT